MESPASAFEKVINDFISRVSFKYNISHSELVSLWGSKQESNSVPIAPSSAPSSSVTSTSTNSSELSKMGKTELMELCRRRGLKTGGTKDALIERITGVTQPKKEEPPKSKVTKATSKVEKEAVKTELVKSLVQVKPLTCVISKNDFGNFWHADTRLVYNRDSKKFFGKQASNGKIESLTSEDIETCNKYKFPFIMPDNLSKAEKVVVSELDDEDPIGGLEEEDEDVPADEDVIEEEEEIVDDE